MKNKNCFYAIIVFSFLAALACKKSPTYNDSGTAAGPGPAHSEKNKETGKTNPDGTPATNSDGTPVGPDGKPVGTPLALVCAKENGKSYLGLGGQKLEAGRVEEAAPQLNRYRLKSFELLQDSYRLALGEVPRSMESYRQTFGQSEARWFEPPVPSVFTNNALFIMGRQIAQNVIKKDKKWNTRTTPDQVKEGCTIFAKRVWKQTPTDEAIKACADYVQSPELAKLSATDRWSYGIALILSSVDFIAY